MSGSVSTSWRPFGMTYRVKQVQPPERSAGGIYLVQGGTLEATEAQVISRGTGRTSDSGVDQRFQARPGERVLFDLMDLEPVGDDGEGVLEDEGLIGIRIPKSPGIQPCNDWLLLRLPERASVDEHGLAVPERLQKRANHGVVIDYGPGRVMCQGVLSGLRLTCGELLDASAFGDVRGLVLYWKRDARLMEVVGGEPNLALVRAGSIMAIQDEGDGDGKRSDRGSAIIPKESGRL